MNQIQTRPSVEGIVNSLYSQQQERADGNRSAREIRQRMEADKPKLEAQAGEHGII